MTHGPSTRVCLSSGTWWKTVAQTKRFPCRMWRQPFWARPSVRWRQCNFLLKERVSLSQCRNLFLIKFSFKNVLSSLGTCQVIDYCRTDSQKHWHQKPVLACSCLRYHKDNPPEEIQKPLKSELQPSLHLLALYSVPLLERYKLGWMRGLWVGQRVPSWSSFITNWLHRIWWTHFCTGT